MFLKRTDNSAWQARTRPAGLPPLPCRKRPVKDHGSSRAEGLARVKLYDCRTAPSPRRVRIFLAEKGLTLPTVQVDLRHGEQLTPAFQALNPWCTVPVLELDDG